MPFSKTGKLADFAVFHETLIRHKKRTKSRINILRTVLESPSAVLSQKHVCIMKFHVFHAFLQPKRYPPSLLPKPDLETNNTVLVTNRHENANFCINRFVS